MSRRATVLLLLLAVTTVAPAPTAADEPAPPSRLRPGKAHFWDDVVNDQLRSFYDHVVDVGDPGEPLASGTRLRVAFNGFQGGAGMRAGAQIHLYEPGRRPGVDPPTATSRGAFDREAIVDDPPTGRWLFRLTVDNRTLRKGGSRITWRAVLEPPPPSYADDTGRRLLPNLQVLPPYEFGFLPCLTGYDQHGPHGIPPAPGDECLRFSYGHQNAGEGPFEVHFDPARDGLQAGPVTQRIYHADATPGDYHDNRFTDLQDAGTYELHPTHGHYHYAELFTQHLYPVLDDGSLGVPVEASKRGLCGHDYFLVDFHRVYQDPYGAGHSEGCTGWLGHETLETRIALSAGWGDQYGWGLPDNFVLFTGLPAGRYLFRMEVNPQRRLVESDYRDNTGYALLAIDRDPVTRRPTVCLLQRGRGDGPDDPARRLYPDAVHREFVFGDPIPGELVGHRCLEED